MADRQQKEADKNAAAKKAKEQEKARQQQQRVDQLNHWARHPEKYKDLVEDEDPQKAEYRKKKEADKKAAAQKAKEKEKALKQQKRVDKINHYRAISGQAPIGLDGKPKDGKKKKK